MPKAFEYHASFQPFVKEGRRFAKIFAIDDTVNRNNWGVTASARAKALQSLLNAPLLGRQISEPANLVRVQEGLPHSGSWPRVGKFVDFISNGTTYGIAEISSDEAWERIKSGEWNAVSPSIFVKPGHEQDGIVDEFAFDHVLFVDDPAYRNANVKATCEGPNPEFCNFSQALQAALERNAAFAVTEQQLSTIEKAVQSARGILQSLEERLEIILYGKPEPDLAPPPLPLQSQGLTRPGQDVGSSLLTGTQDAREKTRGSPQGGGIVKNSTETVLQAADAWDTVDAPDHFFAYVPAGGTPSDRKLPLASRQKRDLDPDIVRNALARFSQTQLPSEAKALALKKICAAARKFEIESELCGKQGGTGKGDVIMDENKESCIKCTELEARIKELSQPSALEGKVITLEAENKALKQWQAEVLDRELTAKAVSIADLEIQAGVLQEKDKATELEKLKKLDAAALDALHARFQGVVQAIEALPTGPKAKYNAEQTRNAMEDVREAMFGYRRNEKGEVVVK